MAKLVGKALRDSRSHDCSRCLRDARVRHPGTPTHTNRRGRSSGHAGAEAASIAPPDASLTLNLSLRGLENPGPLRMEIADEVGNIVRRADTTRSGERATAKTDGLKAGALLGSAVLRKRTVARIRPYRAVGS